VALINWEAFVQDAGSYFWNPVAHISASKGASFGMYVPEKCPCASGTLDPSADRWFRVLMATSQLVRLPNLCFSRKSGNYWL